MKKFAATITALLTASLCLGLSGCGMQNTQNRTPASDTQSSATSTSSNQTQDSTASPSSSERAQSSTASPSSSERTQNPTASPSSSEQPQSSASTTPTTLSTPPMDMGFYSTDPHEVKKKLKTYPNKVIMSVDQAVKQKILLHSFLVDTQEMRKIWEDFVARVHKCQKEHLKYQQSLLVVTYTDEGDAIYAYVYNHNGTLFVYEDGSRDEYGDRASYYFQTDKITRKKYTSQERVFDKYKIGTGDDSWRLIWELTDDGK